MTDKPSSLTGAASPQLQEADVQLLAWAVTNCHMLARRALARSTSVYDREKWEHVLRICEKAGARSQGVLRASIPTEMTEGAASPVPPHEGMIRELRGFAADLKASGDDGIAALVYYVAELLERRQSVSLDVVQDAIRKGDRHRG